MKLGRHSAPSRFVLAGLFLIISLSLSVGVKNYAAQVSRVRDANAESDLSGYHIYYGKANRS